VKLVSGDHGHSVLNHVERMLFRKDEGKSSKNQDVEEWTVLFLDKSEDVSYQCVQKLM